ncbi:hypothetical protein FRC07_013207 [Ceratobasidium sp. 392]|nr:hypothetical protein FRC07_013207 [Ceratobasidium sp. 392]
MTFHASWRPLVKKQIGEYAFFNSNDRIKDIQGNLDKYFIATQKAIHDAKDLKEKRARLSAMAPSDTAAVTKLSDTIQTDTETFSAHLLSIQKLLESVAQTANEKEVSTNATPRHWYKRIVGIVIGVITAFIGAVMAFKSSPLAGWATKHLCTVAVSGSNAAAASLLKSVGISAGTVVSPGIFIGGGIVLAAGGVAWVAYECYTRPEWKSAAEKIGTACTSHNVAHLQNQQNKMHNEMKDLRRGLEEQTARNNSLEAQLQRLEARLGGQTVGPNSSTPFVRTS